MRSRVASLLLLPLSNASNFGKLQLRLAVVALESAWRVVERLNLGTPNCRFVAATDSRTHHYLALVWYLLILVRNTLTAVQKLHRLLGSLIRVHGHALVSPHAIDDAGLRAAMLPDATLAPEVGRWQLPIAVRMLGLIFI